MIGQVASIEHDLARATDLTAIRDRATITRRALETVARGIDPLGSDRTLRQALDSVVSTAPCRVLVERCEEPRSRDVARALWFCVAEAASNTSKHGPGAGLHVLIHRAEDTISASLADDGPGGADAWGAGLRGLADRVETWAAH